MCHPNCNSSLLANMRGCILEGKEVLEFEFLFTFHRPTLKAGIYPQDMSK